MTKAPHVRWMIRADMAEVLEIEAASFHGPWNEDDFIRCLRQRNCIGMVAELNKRVVGFMVYELHKNRLELLNFAVHPDFRRQGVGTTMIAKLVLKLTNGRRERIGFDVADYNLAGHLFLKSQGFKAVEVISSRWEDQLDGEDVGAYRFVLSVTEQALAGNSG